MRLLALGCIPMPASPVLEPNDLVITEAAAASFDPVEFSGLSISMLLMDCSIAILLLWRRWRFEEEDDEEDDEALLRAAAVRGGRDAAPGPGVFLGGAAAIGTTPFPPTTPPPLAEEPPALPWW